MKQNVDTVNNNNKRLSLLQVYFFQFSKNILHLPKNFQNYLCNLFNNYFYCQCLKFMMISNVSYLMLLINLVKKAQYKVAITFLLYYITASDSLISQQSLTVHYTKLK